MITIFKIFEKKYKYTFLLCVKEPDSHYYWKFTKGKKYKIYPSNIGLRIKDDEGKFDRLIGLDYNYWERKNDNGVIIWSYANGIFTTDNSIEEYEIRENTKKYNI